MSQPEFDAWIDRLFSGVGNLTATKDSLAFAWSEMVMHLGPTEDHKPDIYFIKAARKAAANQVCWSNLTRIRDARKAALAAQEELVAEAEPEQAEGTAE